MVIISNDLIREPEGILRTVCTALGMPFQPAMLSWPAGPKPYDGVWAPWWYKGTNSSTGFSMTVREKRTPMPDHLKPLLGECRAIFQMLRIHAVRPSSTDVPRAVPPAGEGSSCSDVEKSGTHVYAQDRRNENIMIGMRDGVADSFELACVSVLDSGYMLGDGVWEGLRLHKGVLVFLKEHLARVSKEALTEMLYNTVDANGMSEASGVHIRLMVTRGLKPTPYQSPYITIGKPTIVIIPEYKEAAPGPKEAGITLFTCHVRRGGADVQDPMWNSHSKLNCIAACIQAKKAGVDESLMLDPHGFVATCNSVNFFCVRDGEVWAPTTKYQLHGITRANILKLCKAHGIPHQERDFPLTQVYGADESFVTGTFAGLIPVKEVDGRCIGADGKRGPITMKLQMLSVGSWAVGRWPVGRPGPVGKGTDERGPNRSGRDGHKLINKPEVHCSISSVLGQHLKLIRQRPHHLPTVIYLSERAQVALLL
eukprot:gene21413-28371_t